MKRSITNLNNDLNQKGKCVKFDLNQKGKFVSSWDQYYAKNLTIGLIGEIQIKKLSHLRVKEIMNSSSMISKFMCVGVSIVYGTQHNGQGKWCKVPYPENDLLAGMKINQTEKTAAF
ncbi:hypothetical protein ACJMK2_042089 [Sinanodonta woodiana]|uniref:Uncharacterized protein n=1 Tax=Sinanodonta woodiana TaxID=1069815 RepID=A0ABD3W693_SINWO